METFVERELKLEPPSDFVLPALDGDPLEGRLFTSTYYDTERRSLARVGITLRRRVENGLSTWQLKLPRDEGRAEISVPGGPAGPPAPLRDLLRAHLRREPLEQVATLRTRRSGVRVGGREHPVADVTIDAVDILEGARSVGAFVELEIELVDGEPSDLLRLGRRLRKAGAKRSDGAAKVMRVLEVDELTRPASDAPTVAQVRHLLSVQLQEIERHDPGVRLGDDAEDVHRFRVATRRSRAVIGTTRPLLGDALAELAVELKWLAGPLGAVRDLDVLVDRLRSCACDLGDDREAAEAIVAQLEDDREHARDALLAAMGGERYFALLDMFSHALEALPSVDSPAGVRKLAAKELRKLRRAVDGLSSDPPDDELHAVRMHAKRARYAAELVAIGGGGKPLSRYVAALKRVQDVIGDHQDAVVAEVELRRVVHPGTAVAAGRLIEREWARRRRCRAVFPSVVRVAVERGSKALS